VATSLPRGVLLAFEGIDGSGKSTQAKLLAELARARGLDVVLTREPTDGPWGRAIRQARFTARLSPKDELAAFLADRKEHVETLIAPALARGALVIVDRYYYSNAAYQGARGLDPKELLALNRAFAPPPDLVLLFDVDPHISLQRITSRGEGQDLFETLDALTKVRAHFLALDEPRLTVIDGARATNEVFREVLSHLRAGPLSSM
jgi:dTMP kinase